jgi:hypothetical protein
MAKTRTKTKYTNASVEGYITARGNEQQRADSRELSALLKKITQQADRVLSSRQATGRY